MLTNSYSTATFSDYRKTMLQKRKRKKGRKEGKKEGKEGRKEGRKKPL